MGSIYLLGWPDRKVKILVSAPSLFSDVHPHYCLWLYTAPDEAPETSCLDFILDLICLQRRCSSDNLKLYEGNSHILQRRASDARETHPRYS